MRYGKLSATWILSMVCLGVPAVAQRVVDEIAIIVNDDIILKSDIATRRALVEASVAPQLEGQERQRALAALAEMDTNLVRDLIDETLLLQKAEEFDIDATVAVVQQMDSLREEFGFETLEQLYAAIEAQGDSPDDFEDAMATQYLTQQVFQNEVDYQIRITTEELRERYEANLEKYDSPEGVAIQEIVFATAGRDVEEVRQRAQEVLARVRDGEDFQMVAFEESESPTSRDGGRLGYIERGSLREEYEAVAYQLRRNEISDLIELPDGFAIIKLERRHEGGLLPFELARDEIAFEIQSERAPAARREYLDQLRRDSFIELHEGYTDSGAIQEPAEGP